MERDFKGVWIPKEIWLNENLSAIDKIIFTEINSLDSEEHGCFASNEYLAKFCQVSSVTVSRSISKLCNLGLLEIKSFDGRHRELKGCLIKMIRQTYQNDNTGFSNCNANNIDNNLENNIYSPQKEKDNFCTDMGKCPNPMEYFFSHWNVTTEDLTGREAGALSYMDFEKLNAAMEKSKSFLQTDNIARYITFYIRNYKRIIAGYYDDDKHNPSKSTSKSKNAAEPPRERYDMKAICAEDRSGGVF